MEEYEFVCPECSQTIVVNEEMHRAILNNGCPVCTAGVTATAFEES